MATPASFVWRPSRARVVDIDGCGLLARGAPSPVPLAWPAKDPGDVLDYTFDISSALIGDAGDSIATLDVQISPGNPGDLLLQSAAADGECVVLWLEAGQAGTVYAVSITIGTTAGRLIVRSVSLPVVALTVLPEASDILTDGNGAPLSDGNGSAILVG